MGGSAWIKCKYSAILCKEFKHLWILLSVGVLEPNLMFTEEKLQLIYFKERQENEEEGKGMRMTSLYTFLISYF